MKLADEESGVSAAVGSDPEVAGATRLAMLFPWDSKDRGVVSGTGFGLAGAMEELGVEVQRVEARPPRRILGLLGRATKARWLLTEHHAEDTWRSGIESTMARNGVANIRLRRGGHLDGVVQLSSDFYIHRPHPPLVTYDDMTIRQAVAYGYQTWRLAGHDLRWRIERQRHAYQQAVGCCTRSAWTGASIVTDYGIDPGKVRVVGVGRNREIPPSAQRDWTKPTFLIVAADWERKNGPRLLTAFAALRQRHPDAVLHVVGRHPRIDLPGVEPHGFLSLNDEAEKARLDDLFARSTCFVMPSLHEPLGISFAEAGGAGIPSIGTTSGGSREIIGPGGTVVDPFDLDALIEAMERFCDPGFAAAAGERAREHAELYTWRRVAKRILAALGQLDREQDPEAAFLPGPQ